MTVRNKPRAKPVLVVSDQARASTPQVATNPPATRLEQVRYALQCARTARDWLREAGADNAARYVARAIKSVEGAERHAQRLQNEGERQ